MERAIEYLELRLASAERQAEALRAEIAATSDDQARRQRDLDEWLADALSVREAIRALKGVE